MVRVEEYLDEFGRSPFGIWFSNLPAQAAAKVVSHVSRLAEGNLSNVKSVGLGVHEKRIDWGPGLRVYFANHGKELVLLLAGSGKGDQSRAIKAAQERWMNYKRRK